MPIVIDERLPALAEIDEPNRQQGRRVERHPTTCPKCTTQLTPADLCFADGRDCHRSCAEAWNVELLAAWEQLNAQDVAEGRQEDQAERARLMEIV